MPPALPSRGSDRLSAQHRRIQVKANLRAALLFGPLFGFVLATFVVPILGMLVRSVENQEVIRAFPRTVAALALWQPDEGAPPETAFSALVADLKAGHGSQNLIAAARRLNLEIPGFRTVITRTAQRLTERDLFPPVRDGVLKADPAWQQFSYWAAIKRNGSRVTSYYYLRAFDLQRNVRDEVERTPRSEAIFVTVLGRTLWISLIVMLICLAIAYPLAYTMTAVGPSTANVMMTMLLIPLWTSLLVRSIAWVVLLQREGLVNDAFLRLGLFDERIRLVFNRTGLLIAMVHVLLPFMVLPIYSVMKGIGRQHMRAALSLGATPIRAFTSVYLPLSMPGVGAGCLLVFIIAVGYYITPELVGGGNDQMLSHFIAYYTNQALNWGQAAALAVVLLVVIALLYPIYARVSQPTAFLLK